jgi:prolyl oligopeptidase
MAATYPQAERQDIVEDLHGQQVADPYRWLEDAESEQTIAWLRAQDALYAENLARLPGRQRLAERLTALLDAGLVSPPSWRGGREFFMRRAGGQEHAVLYTARPAGTTPEATEAEPERVLLDPMAIDPSGATTLDSWQPDHEGRLLAYQLSEGGTEESVLQVIDIASGELVDGPIDRCRYSSIAWLPGGKAFYYVRRLPPDQVPAGEQQFHRRVYLHRLGSLADDDVEIFGAGLDKTNYYGVSVSRDGRWLVLVAAAGTAPRNDAWLADLSGADLVAPDLRVVQQGEDARTTPWPGRDGRIYVYTDAGAPRGRLAVADASDPAWPLAASWRDLLAEDAEAVLSDIAILDGPELTRPVMLAARTRHAISEVSVHDLATGELLGQVDLPGLGTVTGLTERPEGGHEAWLGYTDNVTPAAVIRYDAVSGTATPWARAPGEVKIPKVRSEQIAFPSADGTIIRMLVISPNDRSGPVPTILYGYGGFSLSLTPAYSASVLAWVEAGGSYAIAGLRGGGEEGEDWHRAGMRERKQNVFDDFRAAADKLISDGFTTPAQLAVSGGSNGGLLVGAFITQWPELSAAAVCSAPLLDMVRYEKFGLGESWNDEYGTAADPVELGWLLGYSPYHRVAERTSYPAVLFTVFDGDTRVDPLHARKMCAALQQATASPAAGRPVLLRRESQVGHGARAISKSVALSAETLAFAAAYTGLSI